MFAGVSVDVFQVRRLREQSNGSASGLQHPLDAGVHFFLFNKLAPFGGGNPFLHGFKKSCLILDVSGEGVSHEFAGLAALLSRKVR